MAYAAPPVLAGRIAQNNPPQVVTSTTAPASEAVDAPAAPEPTPPVLESTGTLVDPEYSPITPSLTGLADDRPWKLVLFGTARATYDSNIFISNTDEKEDYIFRIAPGVAFGYGDYKNEIYDIGPFRERFLREKIETIEEKNFFYVSYNPSYTWFINNNDQDKFDHDAVLDASWQIQKLQLGIDARYQTLNLPDVDLGERIEQQRFDAALTSLYTISDKTSVELNAHTWIKDYEPVERNDVAEYQAETWLNYLIFPKVNISAGFAAGHVEVTGSGATQNYGQALLRARYRATKKFQLNVVAGVEYRDIQGFDDRINPVFSLGATYSPFDGSTISLSAYSRTATSAATGATSYTANGVALRLQQRFYQRFYATLQGGVQWTEYDNQASDAPDREDDYFFVRPGLGIDITRWLSCEISGEYRQNDSTQLKNTFDATSAYVQFNLLF